MAGDTISASQLVLRSQFAWSAWTVSEVEGSATASGITIPGSDGNRSALFRQYVRLGEFRLGALDFDAVRLFGGAGAGRTSRYSLDSRGTAQHLGLSSTHGPLSFTVTVQRATSDDWQLFEPTGIGLKRPAASYELRDVTTELSWQRGRVALSTSGSWRAGVGATSGKGQVLATAVSWNAVGPLTLIAQAGEQLADPLRGIPQATYAGLSVRVQRSRGNAPGLRDALRRDALGRASRASETTAFDALRDAEYQLERSGNGATLVLRVAAASDAVVEMACSATEWRTVRMTREGAEWIARLPLASGTHRVALRVNGGDWRAPRGLSRVSDDFGGSVGLLVVP